MKDLNRALQFIKTTLESLTKASLKVLTGHIYTVKLDEKDVSVSNFPETQQVEGKVEVTNGKDYDAKIDEIRKAVAGLSGELSKAIKESKVTKLEVSNLKDVVIPTEVSVKNQVKEVEVSNLDALYSKLEKIAEIVGELPKEYPEFPKIPEVKIPEYPKFPKIPEHPKEITVKNLEKYVKKLDEFFNTDAKKYLTVRLSNGKEFYEAITEVVSGVSVPYSSVTGKRSQALIDDSRRQVIVNGANPIDGYQITDKADSSNPKYYGFTNVDGAWYIMENNVTAGTFRYISGTSAYVTNWNGRAELTYKRFYDAF